jgi:hypothetical protein
MKGSDQLQDLGVGLRIMLKRNLLKYGGCGLDLSDTG